MPAPRFERYRLTYPSGTVVMAFYAGGAPLEEVRMTHPMAVADVIEDSLDESLVSVLITEQIAPPPVAYRHP